MKTRIRKAPQTLLDPALHLRQMEDMEGAERALSALIADYPEDLDLRVIYAGVLFNLQRFTEAALHFERILTARPTSEVASKGLFHSLWSTERKQEAVNEVKRFYAAGGESAEYNALVSRIRDALSNSD